MGTSALAIFAVLMIATIVLWVKGDRDEKVITGTNFLCAAITAGMVGITLLNAGY